MFGISVYSYSADNGKYRVQVIDTTVGKMIKISKL